MTQNEMAAEIARLTAANAELKARIEANKKPATITLRVSQKGGVSVYGLGRFPVTLYVEQWQRLLAKKDDLLGFIKANADKLTSKGEKAA
jgi:hypothetical protein